MQQHVLRFWETKFPFIRPTKRAGGRRFYRPQDLQMLLGVKTLLYDRGYTIRGVQKLFKEEGQGAILTPADSPSDMVLTEQGLVPADQVPQGSRFDVAGGDMDKALALSADTRERFMAIARALEEAQEALGRQIGRPGGRGAGRGKFS